MNIAVIFGGKSCEHNISIATGVQAANALLSTGNKIICIYITRRGVWKTGKAFFDCAAFSGDAGGRTVFFLPGDNRLHYRFSPFKTRIDCAVLCLHGRNGEDGTVQGALELSGVPYTGSGVLGSAAGMDKQIMKKLFRADKLPYLKSITAHSRDKTENIIKKAAFTLGYPVIVKPARAGSSIGIGVAHDEEQLQNALVAAFMWDNKVIIERAVDDFTELNCAVIGSPGNEEASRVEKPVSYSEFLTYDEKYHGKAKSGGDRQFPADIDKEQEEKIRALAIKVFRCVEAEGIARIDFILDNKSGKLYVNEINTIPGSLAMYLFPEKGRAGVIMKLVSLAVARYKEQSSLKYEYDDKLLYKG